MSGGASSSEGGLGDLFAKLQAAQADLEEQVAAIDTAVVEGTAAGGAVAVRISGSFEAEAVHIDPGIIDPADPALLEDLVLAALRDALGQVGELRSSLQSPAEPGFAGAIDVGALMGNLDFGGLLGGIDMSALMGSLAIGEETEEGTGSGDGEGDGTENEPEA